MASQQNITARPGSLKNFISQGEKKKNIEGFQDHEDPKLLTSITSPPDTNQTSKLLFS